MPDSLTNGEGYEVISHAKTVWPPPGAKTLKQLENELRKLDREIIESIGVKSKRHRLGFLKYRRADVWVDYLEAKYGSEGLE